MFKEVNNFVTTVYRIKFKEASAATSYAYIFLTNQGGQTENSTGKQISSGNFQVRKYRCSILG
jgi:hypothetical protein